MTDETTGATKRVISKKERWRRAIRRIVKTAIIVYVGICIAVYFAQGWMIFPAASYQHAESTKIIREPDSEVLKLKSDMGETVAAIYGPALLKDGEPDPDAAHRPTIIYFYGNGGAIAWSMNEFDQFRRLGANVIIPDFIGFGQSSGKASEASLYETADTAYDYLIHRPNIDKTKILVFGWSIGSAVAIDLASRKPVAGLATFNAFTSMREMARKTMPWLPTTILLKYRFENERKMAGISCPVFICNGLQDTLVPAEMSERLAKAARGPVTRVTIDTADHNTIFVAKPADLFSGLRGFVERVTTSQQRLMTNDQAPNPNQ